MSSFGLAAVSYVVNSVWQAPLIAGAAWVVSRILKRLGPGAQHLTWVAALGMALVTPALSLSPALLKVLSVDGRGSGHASVALVAVPVGGSNGHGAAVLTTATVSLFLLLYGCVTLYFAIRLTRSVYWTARLARRATPIELVGEQEEMRVRCARDFGLADVRILESAQVAGPVTLGFRDAVVLLPVGFAESCAASDLLAALAHECAHIKRRDFEKNLVYEAASLAIAFHPVTWMLKSQIAQTREMICDAMAVDGLLDARIYTTSLLRLAAMISTNSQAMSSHAIGILDANILEKRIMMMKTKREMVSAWMKFGLVWAATAVLLTAAVGGALAAVKVAPPTTSAPDGEVYAIGDGVSAPMLIYTLDPEFPASAKDTKVGFSAKVVVGMIVDDSGTVQDVHVVHSFNPDFDAKAMEAIQHYRFKPAQREGKPVAVRLNVEVNFKKF